MWGRASPEWPRRAELSESSQGRGGQRRVAQLGPLLGEIVLFFRDKTPLLKGSFWTRGNKQPSG